ncbi:MAG: zinc-finger domain-containing protein [Chromatiales bacterium]|nr:zinc-finger domain-containing protein [Chromatiales bacterium]
MSETAASPVTKVIDVMRKDLPLACPDPKSDLASMHPKVFLPIEKTGEATCPYCGANYRLID